MDANSMTLHHVKMKRWMADSVRALGEGTQRKDSHVIRDAITEYLEKYGITEEDFLLSDYQS